MQTYNVDHQTPDSAGTGTAYLCGVKTNMGIIGMDAGVLLGQCDNSTGREATSILRWSHAAGKSTWLCVCDCIREMVCYV